MKRHEAFPGTYFKAADILDGDVTLTIGSVTREPVGDEKEEKTVITFNDEDKKLVVNATKWDAMEAMTGEHDETNKWIGKTIVLTTGKTKYGGKPVDCILIRDDIPF